VGKRACVEFREPFDDLSLSTRSMEVGIRILFFFELSDFDNAFGAFIEQSDNLVIDPIDFLTIFRHIFGHAEPCLGN
jgi:hypothetical protein